MRLLAALVALLLVLSGSTAFSSVSQADGPFCNADGSWHGMSRGDKCIHGAYHSYTYAIWGYINSSRPALYDLCALSKEHYAAGGGTGGNTMPLYCSAYHYDYARSVCGLGYGCDGYAEIIDQGPGGQFRGEIEF